jgi:hypothetical protein
VSVLIRFEYDEIRPSIDDVRRRLGIPPDVASSPALKDLLREAARRVAGGVDARAVMMPVDAAGFAAVFEGEGRNAADSPLLRVYPRASSLALFVATIGPALEKDVAARFRDGDPALAFVLDAHASATMNRVVDALASQFGATHHGASVLPYSPGYCGWDLTGQRAIFAAVGAGRIGVALGPSCLMNPVKSVSGVLVAGDAAVHRFRPDFDFCEECETHECVPRMASVARR